MKSLKDLFIENLRRAYETEKQLVKALPKLHEAARYDELRYALHTHLEQTELRVDRLEQVFEWFDEKPNGKKCQSIKGILDDGKPALDLEGDADVKDAAIIAAAQEAEHFEIALYGTLRTWASVLGKTEAMEALEVTLEEEKTADSLLTGLAATLNSRAAHAE
jgi:ferritin-like metal-binding protein YciE